MKFITNETSVQTLVGYFLIGMYVLLLLGLNNFDQTVVTRLEFQNMQKLSSVYTNGEYNTAGVLNSHALRLNSKDRKHDLQKDKTLDSADILLMSQTVQDSIDGVIKYSKSLKKFDLKKDKAIDIQDWGALLDYFVSSDKEVYIYDISGDGRFDLNDIELFTAKLDASLQSGVYVVRVDFTADGVVDENDFKMLVDFISTHLSNDRISLQNSSLNPLSSVIKVDKEGVTSDVTVFAFELEAEDGDVTVKEIPLLWKIDTLNFDDIILDVHVTVDGERMGEATTEDAGTQDPITTINFGDGFLVSDEENVDIKVLVDIKPVNDNYHEGQGFHVSIPENLANGSIVANDEKGLIVIDINGSATSESHYLMSEGIFAQIVSTDAGRISDDYGNDVGAFSIRFDVTAFEDDFYLSTHSSVFSYHIQNSDDAKFTGDIVTSVVYSTADENAGGVYVVQEGNTETFTLEVQYAPTTEGMYRMQLDTIEYSGNEAMPYGVIHHAIPKSDFVTRYVFLGGSVTGDPNPGF